MERGRGLAWGLGALVVAVLAGIVVLDLTGGSGEPALWLAPLTVVAFPVVGALVASRQPGNAVGWLLLAAGACLAVSLFGSALSSIATAWGTGHGGVQLAPWRSSHDSRWEVRVSGSAGLRG